LPGFRKTASAPFPYLHPGLVSLSLAAAGLQHVNGLPQHRLPVGHDIEGAGENHGSKIACPKPKPGSATDRPLASDARTERG
jgi:hypothetical protein